MNPGPGSFRSRDCSLWERSSCPRPPHAVSFPSRATLSVGYPKAPLGGWGLGVSTGFIAEPRTGLSSQAPTFLYTAAPGGWLGGLCGLMVGLGAGLGAKNYVVP